MKQLLTNNWTLGILFSLGLIMSGSIGEWFPWTNIIGAIMLGSVAIIANHIHPVRH